MSNEELHATTSLSIPRSFGYSSGVAIVCLAVLTVALILSKVFSLIPEEAALAVSLLCTLLSFSLSWVGFTFPGRGDNHPLVGNSPSQRRLRFWIPFVFSMALAFHFLGNIIHIYNNFQNISIFPTWADAAILGAYPLLLVGVLGFPVQTLVRSLRLRITLDSSLIIIALVTFSWYFILGPMLIRHQGESLLSIVAHLAFPASDLLLISYVIFFTAYASNSPQRLTVSILSTALIIFALTDSIYQYQLLHNVFLPGWCILGWCAGSLMIALAVQPMRWLPIHTSALKDDIPSQATRLAPIWQLLLPYTLVPVVFGLAFYLWGTDRASTLAIGTYCLSVVLLTLVFVKQIVAIREIHWLNRGLRLTQHHLHEKNAALEKANTRLEALATTDPLTELPNHRSLQASLTQELHRAQRNSHDCTLLFFDLDHFKALNDGYGHAAGDEALSAFGRLLREQIRIGDIVGRWGGEEFVAILPETTMQEARFFAERLCEVVDRHRFAIAGGLHLTCSIGVASYPTHSTILNDLVSAADQAMYAAKRLGRNQWRSIDDPEAQRVIGAGDNSDSREETMLRGVVNALVSLVERHDAALGDHSYEVADLVEHIARKLGSSPQEVQMMRRAGHLHDIGKIGVPDAILQKPARLTEAEWQQMKLHPEAGAEVVANIPSLRPLAPVIRAHHERWDGTGYPDRLQAETIPLAARVISVADAYMAMVVDRPYQSARSVEGALDELRRCSGTQFDPQVINALVDIHREQVRSAWVKEPVA